MTDAQRRRKANRPTPAQRPPSFAGETLVVEQPTRPGAQDGPVRILVLNGRPTTPEGAALMAIANAHPPSENGEPGSIAANMLASVRARSKERAQEARRRRGA